MSLMSFLKVSPNKLLLLKHLVSSSLMEHLAGGGGGVTHPIAHDIFFMTNFFLGETKIKKKCLQYRSYKISESII